MHRELTRPRLAADKEWRNAIFDGPPARRVTGRSRHTHRSVIQDPRGADHMCEGGNEMTAALLLNHFFRVGLVQRYKFQPFSLDDYGGSQGYPDLLVELYTGDLVVVEVKSAKYLTAEYLTSFRDRERELIALGLSAVLWTDKDSQHAYAALGPSARNNLLDIERCSRMQAREPVLERLNSQVRSKRTRLAELLSSSGATWDDLMFAWSHNYIQGPLKEPLNETTYFHAPAAPSDYASYFQPWAGSASWWGRLPDLALDQHERGPRTHRDV